MDFWRTILGLLRRRYVGPPVLVCSIILAAAAYLIMPTRYVASATMVLSTSANGSTLPANPGEQPGQTNPFLNFDERLRTSAAILIQAMSTPQVAEELGVDKDGSRSLTINDGRTTPELLGTSGPFIFIEVESASAGDAHDVVVLAQERMRQELFTRQKSLNAPPSTFITMIDVVAPSAGEPRTAPKWQISLAALALGILLGVGGAYAALRVQENRRRRPAGQTAQPKTPDAVEPDTAEMAFADDGLARVPKVNGVHTPVLADTNGASQAEHRRLRWATAASRGHVDWPAADLPEDADAWPMPAARADDGSAIEAEGSASAAGRARPRPS